MTSTTTGEIDPAGMNPADYVDALRNQRFDEELRMRRARKKKDKQTVEEAVPVQASQTHGSER